MGGAEEGKLIIRTYYVRKNNFQSKDKFNEISLTFTLNYRTKRINNTLEEEKQIMIKLRTEISKIETYKKAYYKKSMKHRVYF